VSLIIYKAIAALLIFFISIATALYPLKKKIFQHAGAVAAGEAVASGIFLGAAFFHLLPDSIRLFQHVYGSLSYPLPEAICAGGFLLLLFLERIALKKPSSPSTSAVPLILATILIIHAVIEGAALGIGATLSETVMLFIAILAHKGSESFALCIALLRHQIATRRVIMIILFFALMTPLGIALGAVINHLTFARDGELAAAVFNACAAGTFLYISTLHHIHFHKHARDERQGLLEFICLVSGTVVMGVIALWT
jgi:zinc transporter ZupT